MARQCRKAEKVHAKHDAFHFHKKLKEIVNIFKKANISKTAKNNKILTDLQEICRGWMEYIRDLFDKYDVRSVAP
jgi:ABC-type glycerol-3-phosphate transport system substrate-binding protein